MIEFTIYGKPQHKRRVRATARNGFVKTYRHKDEIDAETTIQAIAQAYRPSKPLEGQLKATVKAFFPIPKSVSKKRRMQMLYGTVRPVVKPDCDNIAKIYLDALNGIIYHDDKQIAECVIVKKYDDTPRVVITIEEI